MSGRGHELCNPVEPWRCRAHLCMQVSQYCLKCKICNCNFYLLSSLRCCPTTVLAVVSVYIKNHPCTEADADLAQYWRRVHRKPIASAASPSPTVCIQDCFLYRMANKALLALQIAAMVCQADSVHQFIHSNSSLETRAESTPHLHADWKALHCSDIDVIPLRKLKIKYRMTCNKQSQEHTTVCSTVPHAEMARSRDRICKGAPWAPTSRLRGRTQLNSYCTALQVQS